MRNVCDKSRLWSNNLTSLIIVYIYYVYQFATHTKPSYGVICLYSSGTLDGLVATRSHACSLLGYDG